MLAPWAELTLIAALIAAAAAPAALIAAGDHWRVAAEDEVALSILDGQDVDDIGIDLSIESTIDRAAIDSIDPLVRNELSELSRLGSIRRLTYTLPTVARVDDQVLTQVRVMSTEGALAAAGIPSDNPGDGVWISQWLADRFELEAGDILGVEASLDEDSAVNDVVPGGGTALEFPIAGIYETIWQEEPGGLAPFWDALPRTVIPRWIGPFRAPNFTLVLTDEATLGDSRLTGFVRWRAPVDDVPVTFDESRQLELGYRLLESELSQPGTLRDRFLDLSAPQGQGPVVATAYDEAMSEIRRAVRRIGPPMRASQATGVLIGLVTVAAIGVVLVDRRRNEYRLLAGEGERWIRLAVRTAVQTILPFVLGTGAGVVLGSLVARVLGPEGRAELAAVQWSWIIGVAVIGWLLGAVLAGLLGQATLESVALRRLVAHPAVPIGGAIVLAGFSVLLWVQAGEPAGPDSSIGIGATLLPVALLLTAVWLLFASLRAVLALGRRASAGFPVPLLLATRRLSKRHGSTRLAAGILGIGLGLLSFSIVLDQTLDRTVTLRLATEIGGVSALDVTGTASAPLPPETTELRVQDTVVTPGQDLVRVVAVQDGWVDAVSWPDEYGIEQSLVDDLLTRRGGETIPVILIASEGLPENGAFGRVQRFPYEVVGRATSLPRAGQFGATLLVSAEVLNEWAFEESVAADRVDTHRPPTNGYRRVAVSQRPLPELISWADTGSIGFRNERWTVLEAARADVAATRFAFDFIRVVGAVAGIVGATALALQLSARRRTAALSSVMLRTMGLTPLRSAAAVVVEVLVATLLAAVVGLVLGPVMVSRLSGRFDPSPDALPVVQVEVPWLELGGLMVAVVAVVGLAALVGELAGLRRPAAEVVREYG